MCCCCHSHISGHHSFVASLLSPGPGQLLSIGQILFWHGIEPIRHRIGTISPLRIVSCTVASSSAWWPLNLIQIPFNCVIVRALGSRAFVLLTDKSGDKHLVHYTFCLWYHQIRKLIQHVQQSTYVRVVHNSRATGSTATCFSRPKNVQKMFICKLLGGVVGVKNRPAMEGNIPE